MDRHELLKLTGVLATIMIAANFLLYVTYVSSNAIAAESKPKAESTETGICIVSREDLSTARREQTELARNYFMFGYRRGVEDTRAEQTNNEQELELLGRQSAAASSLTRKSVTKTEDAWSSLLRNCK